jgi:hypothetical protein
MLPRLHAPELMDEAWCPPALRRMETDFLRTFAALSRIYTPIVEDVAGLLAAAEAPAIVDLCSGGGGPVLPLKPMVEARLGRPVRLTLTDIFPHPEALDVLPDRAGITYRADPIDARRVPRDLVGVRTVFLAMHHLRPPDARAMLADAADAGRPIVVVEVTERSVRGLALMATLPLGVALSAPFSRPRTLARFASHWALPVVPAVVGWDGVCSSLRSYRTDEMAELARGLPGVWKVQRRLHRGFPVTWMVGRP